MLMGLLLALSLLPTGDASKTAQGAQALNGKWDLHLAIEGKHLLNQGNIFVTISDQKIAWTKLPYFTDEKGECKLTVDPSKSPSTIELKVGDKVYKGIYRLRPAKNGRPEQLDLLIATKGSDFPKAFGASELELPKEFTGVLLMAARIE